MSRRVERSESLAAARGLTLRALVNFEMFTMAKIRDGSSYLGAHLTSNDYYCENETVPGRWVGGSAERLGLSGEINAKDEGFESLRNNRNPQTGEKLTVREREGRVRLYDFQCSAPKSVSVMAVTVGDARLLAAHDRAVTVAFRELETFAATQANTALTRHNRTTGNVVAASFRHTASRALDPQIHTHLVTGNLTWDSSSNSWRALTEYEMVHSVRYAGKVYQNELAGECRKLGYELTEVRDARGSVTGFELSGVADEVRERFSKRRAQVEVGIAQFEQKHGRTPTTAEVHAITVQTRDAKLKEATTPAVLAAQREQLSSAEWTKLATLKESAEQKSLVHPNPAPPRERESLRLAVGHIYERRSVAKGHEVLAEALNQNLGHIDLSRLHKEAARSGLVPLTNESFTQAQFATARGLAQERWSVAFIEKGQGRFDELAKGGVPTGDKLSGEQRRALNEVLGTRDQVVCLRGSAGVGKTTIIKQLHSQLEDQGKAVFYCAPTTSAVDTLRKGGIGEATTVSDFLQNKVLNERGRLSGAVMVIDEAGLSSNGQGSELLKVAERYNARVIFIGDTKQHTAVEAGDFLRLLETQAAMHTVGLTDIRRQTVAEYRQAVKLMAVGGALGGLESLDRLGWVKEGKADYITAAVSDYLEKSEGGRRLDSVMAVTPTWAENRTFTDQLRKDLKARGVLNGGEMVGVHESLGWTKAQKSKAENYQPGQVVTVQKTAAGFRQGQSFAVLRVEAGKVWVSGDRGEMQLPLRKVDLDVSRVRPMEICTGDKILIRANDRATGLINGEVVSVAAMKDGVLTATDGRKIDTGRFKSLVHGFAVTSHKSQSKTADHVVVAAERLDAKAAYVSLSRGRLSCALHTPDKAELFARLPTGNRAAALEVLADSQAAFIPHSRPAAHSIEPTDWRSRIQQACTWSFWRDRIQEVAPWVDRLRGVQGVDARSVVKDRS